MGTTQNTYEVKLNQQEKTNTHQITGGLGFIFNLIVLVGILSSRDEIIEATKEEINSELITNITEIDEAKESVTDIEITKAVYAYIVIGLIGTVLYCMLFTAFGVFLLIGVYKENEKYVKLWVQVKVILLMIAIFAILLKMIFLLFGFDSNLNGKIIFLVIDGLIILVVFSYYEECREMQMQTALPVTYEY